MEPKFIKAFCSSEQKETDHSIDIDGNGEIVVSCVSNTGTEEAPVVCGRFVKFPKGTTGAELKEGLSKHKFENEGQLTVEAVEKEKAKLLDDLLGEES